MSEATISALELMSIRETLWLVEEEFAGIEEDQLSDYVLTVGADAAVKESMELIEAKLAHLHADELPEEGLDEA